MRLSRIFIRQSLAVGATINLDSAASHYIRNVLRLKGKSNVALFNGKDDSDYHALVEFNDKQTIAHIHSSEELKTESSLDSEIIQGLSRGDHLDLSIQKCTELGVGRISIFNAQHSQIPLKPAQQQKRLAHWQAIAVKACEQCNRHRPPTIEFFSRFETALEKSTDRHNRFLLNFEGPPLTRLLLDDTNQKQVSLLIGPEGGLSLLEIDLAIQNGFTSARVGPRVLRTETAAMASLAIVQSVWGDLTT